MINHSLNYEENLIIKIPKLNFFPDTYTISTFLTINDEISDWLVNAFEIDVETGDFMVQALYHPVGQGSSLTEFSMKSIPKIEH